MWCAKSSRRPCVSLSQMPIEPIDCIILHLTREDVRHVVEAVLHAGLRIGVADKRGATVSTEQARRMASNGRKLLRSLGRSGRVCKRSELSRRQAWRRKPMKK